ncbi:MAG: NUDIX hydrolase [Thermoactinomyces sp.]
MIKLKENSAGGVVFRKRNGKIEILMIEDRFGKWTLPKGKLEPGETDEQTALREIEEETGIRGRIVRSLAQVGYTYEHQEWGEVVKTVHYFLVEALKGEETPQLEEINGVKWLTMEKAWEKQQAFGYGNNETVLKKAINLLDRQ